MKSIAVAVLLLACQGCASESGPPPTSSPPSPGSSQVGPLASPSPEQSMVAIQAMADGGNTMFPGMYETKFDPPMTITINNLVDLDCAPGYRCRGDIDVNLAHWLDLEFGNVHGAELHVMGIEKVFASASSDKLVDPPNDLVNWITRQPGLQLRDLVPVVIGGINGTRLDFEADRIVHFGSTGVADLPCCGIGPKTRTWLSVLKVENHWVLIMEAFGPENTIRDFDAVVRGLQPVVDSIVWN